MGPVPTPSDEDAKVFIAKARGSIDSLEAMNVGGELWEEDVQALESIARLLARIADGDFNYSMVTALKSLAE